jgi:hypothetical protein
MSDVEEHKTEEEEPPACPVKRGTQARESKQYYREIRKELGLGARDPVPEKFIRRKTYKPVVFEEKEKDILANEDIPLLKKEVRDKKRAMIDSKYKTELKQERMAAMIKQAVDDAFMRKTLYKNANRRDRRTSEDESPRRGRGGDTKAIEGGGPSGDTPSGDPFGNPSGQHTPKRTRMRLPDGSIVEL